jgi:hypothetical protein
LWWQKRRRRRSALCPIQIATTSIKSIVIYICSICKIILQFEPPTHSWNFLALFFSWKSWKNFKKCKAKNDK